MHNKVLWCTVLHSTELVLKCSANKILLCFTVLLHYTTLHFTALTWVTVRLLVPPLVASLYCTVLMPPLVASPASHKDVYPHTHTKAASPRILKLPYIKYHWFQQNTEVSPNWEMFRHDIWHKSPLGIVVLGHISTDSGFISISFVYFSIK